MSAPRTSCALFTACLLVTLSLAKPHSTCASPDSTRAHLEKPPSGASFLLPAASFFLPGLGQYGQGAWLPGLAFTGTAAAGLGVALSQEWQDGDEFPPRTRENQLISLGAQAWIVSGGLSSYDSFHRSLAALKGQGEYDFVTRHARTRDLLWAPFDLRYLKRPTTLIPGALAGALTMAVIAGRSAGDIPYEPFDANDIPYIVATSYGAGVGEDAFFRGWLYPWAHESLGRNFWISNSVQSLVFGAAHIPGGTSLPLVQVAGGFYMGWVAYRNDWDIRESIFQHFWYDVVVFTWAYLLEEQNVRFNLTLPTLRF